MGYVRTYLPVSVRTFTRAIALARLPSCHVTYVCNYVRTYVHVWTFVEPSDTCVHARGCTYVARSRILNVNVATYVYPMAWDTHVRIYLRTSVRRRMRARAHLKKKRGITLRTYVSSYARTYARRFIRSHTHIYTHAHVRACVCSGVRTYRRIFTNGRTNTS